MKKYIPHLIALIALILLGIVLFLYFAKSSLNTEETVNTASILYANGKEVQ
jgi:hypothetical protein